MCDQLVSNIEDEEMKKREKEDCLEKMENCCFASLQLINVPSMFDIGCP